MLSFHVMLRKLQLRCSSHLVRMDNERLLTWLIYGDVATGSRRQRSQEWRHKDTLKASLKRLKINPANWEDLVRDRPTWRRTLKTGVAIYEANHIIAAKAKCEAHKSQLLPCRNPNTQPPQPVRVASGRSGHQSALLDIFGPSPAPGRHHPISPRPPLPRLPCRQSTLATPLNTHCHPPSPQHLLRWLLPHHPCTQPTPHRPARRIRLHCHIAPHIHSSHEPIGTQTHS
ncbi:hypothetical protein SprV_0100286100 [Sparganum proliferum]